MRYRIDLGIASLALGLMLSACAAGAGSPVAEPTPTDSAAVPPSASAEPTPTPTPDMDESIATDALAVVITNDLVVRSLPEISAESTIHPVTLSEGKLLYVLDGPVVADGYDWYQVAPFDEFLDDIPTEGPRLGWVAAGTDAEAWIAPLTGRCPEPTLEEIRWRSPLMSLGCYAGDELTLEGVMADCSYDTPGTISPEWLANSYCELRPFDFEEGIVGGLALRLEDWPPSQGKGAAVRVIGHFDDAAAQTCVEHPLQGETATPPELVILWCRSEFVATDITDLPAGS